MRIPKTMEAVVKDEFVEDLDELITTINEAELSSGIIRITKRFDRELYDAIIVVLNGRVAHVQVENVTSQERWEGEEALEVLTELLADLSPQDPAVLDIYRGPASEVKSFARYQLGVEELGDYDLASAVAEAYERAGVAVEGTVEFSEEEEEKAEEASEAEEVEVPPMEVEEWEVKAEGEEAAEEEEKIEELSREELLKKYGIEEPDESFVESILEDMTGASEDLRKQVERVLRGYGITIFQLHGTVVVEPRSEEDIKHIEEAAEDLKEDLGLHGVEVRIRGKNI
ncbi:MAG: DUF2226 domain-containing protein [Euryarchaeota archaeon]